MTTRENREFTRKFRKLASMIGDLFGHCPGAEMPVIKALQRLTVKSTKVSANFLLTRSTFLEKT